jgi:hypothetical protein
MFCNPCPRFSSCNAPICPLDPSWRKAVHLPGEPTCYYLRAAAKAGAAERFKDDATFEACAAPSAEVCRRFPSIGRALEQAAKSGFQGDHLRKRPAA